MSHRSPTISHVYIIYIYICYPPPPKIDHFLCFEKDAVHYCKKQMCICWGRHSSAVLLRTVAKLRTCQGCNTARLCKTAAWQPEVSTLQEFPRHCPSKAAKLQTWQSKSAKLQALQALVAKQTWQGFSSNTARLCKTATPTNLPKHCPRKGAKLQTWQGCKIANLQGSNAAGPAPTLQDFPSKSAKLQGPGKVAKLPTCKGSNTAGLQNYSPCQPCQPAKVSTLQASHLLQGLPNYK